MANEINLCCNLVTDKATQIFFISSQKICSIVYITIHLFPFFFFYFSFIFSCDRLGPLAFSALELTSSSQASGRTCDRRFGRTMNKDEGNTTQPGYICVPRTGFETAIAVYRLSLTADHMTKPEYLPVYGTAGPYTHTTGSKLRCQTPTKHTTKYLWNTTSNFSQAQLYTPWWWIT